MCRVREGRAGERDEPARGARQPENTNREVLTRIFSLRLPSREHETRTLKACKRSE